MVNGILVARVGIPSFIATLGTQFFWSGMATLLSGGKSYALRGADESSVWSWMVGRFGDPTSLDWNNQISIQALWTARSSSSASGSCSTATASASTFCSSAIRTTSPAWSASMWSARRSELFTLMGGLAALAAMMLTLENKNYFGNQGQGYLLTAIAAVLIGGTSIFGGRATIVGTVFGCFIIWILEAGLVASGLTGAWVRTVQGLIFLIAIIFYLFVDEPQRRAGLLARLRPSGYLERAARPADKVPVSATPRDGA